MGKVAVGAYLRTLREAKTLARTTFAYQLSTSESLIESIEKGQTDTRGSFLLLLLHTLGGSPEHVSRLMLDADATAEDGRRLALEWLDHAAAARTVAARAAMQWDYLIYRISLAAGIAAWAEDGSGWAWDDQQVLDDLGAAGWELVSVGAWEGEEATAVFKRLRSAH